MNEALPRRKSILEVIKVGGAKHGFYIVPALDQIPGFPRNNDAKPECVRQFARDNGWNVHVDDGNGWLLFTDRISTGENFEDDLDQVAEFIGASLRKNRLLPKTVPEPRCSSRTGRRQHA